MRYLVIREDGIIIGEIVEEALDFIGIDRAIDHGPIEPYITRAIERPGAKAKLYVIEPSPTGRVHHNEPELFDGRLRDGKPEVRRADLQGGAKTGRMITSGHIEEIGRMPGVSVEHGGREEDCADNDEGA